MRVSYEQLAQGSCTTLPLAVVDKYFMADREAERFRWATARAICGRCAVRSACLVDAITTGDSVGVVRAGVPSHEISLLRSRSLSGTVSAEFLTQEALGRLKPPLHGSRGEEGLRKGKFTDAELLTASRLNVVNSTVPQADEGA